MEARPDFEQSVLLADTDLALVPPLPPAAARAKRRREDASDLGERLLSLS
jgi:hypothetical protein